MIWVLIILLAMALLVVCRRYVAMREARNYFRTQYIEAASISTEAVKLNTTILAEYNEYAADMEIQLAQMTALVGRVVAGRDDAHKMLEMALNHNLENNLAWDSVECEIGINGLVYQFHKEAPDGASNEITLVT